MCATVEAADLPGLRAEALERDKDRASGEAGDVGV